MEGTTIEATDVDAVPEMMESNKRRLEKHNKAPRHNPHEDAANAPPVLRRAAGGGEKGQKTRPSSVGAVLSQGQGSWPSKVGNELDP